MTTTLVGGIILEHKGDRVTGVDMRVYRWLERWLNEGEVGRLVFSLAYHRLIRLLAANREAIEAEKVF